MAAVWELTPERWERELSALREAGFEVEEPPRPHAAAKRVLNIRTQHEGRPLRLIATYPTTYPYFPPMVEAPDLELRRHQTPGSRTLCLLKNGGEEWDPGTDTLATLLTEQLPEVFRAQPDGPRENEQGNEAEPVTAYLQPEANSFIGFPQYDLAAISSGGTFRMLVDELRPLRGTVVEVLDETGATLFRSEARDEEFVEAHKAQLITGRWTRLERRPQALDAEAYYALAREQDPKLANPSWQTLPGRGKVRIDVIALLFPDELAWKREAGNAIVISKFQGVDAHGTRLKLDCALHRTELESRSAYFMRDPSADALQRGTVSLIGVGSIGSPAAKLLAQGGIGTLRVADHDILDAGNAIRWELGRGAAGIAKVSVLQQYLRTHFPYTRVESFPVRIGDASTAGHPQEKELYRKLFRDTDCIFDAAAAPGVMQFASEAARAAGVPYVWMHATNGGWGGLVGRADPDRASFCWMCHLYYLAETRDGHPRIEAIPAMPGDHVQPVGCLDPTFIGAQVDLEEVSLMGTRLVIDQILVAKGARPASAYDWNVAVLSLRDSDGQPTLPTWTPYRLPPHDLCPNH